MTSTGVSSTHTPAPGRTLVVRGGGRLSGAAEPPPDKSIAHRALIFAAMAEGESRIRPYRPGLDVAATADALRRLGVAMEAQAPDVLRVYGLGPPRFWPGTDGPVELDCANSGTTMRLLAGLLTGRPGVARLDGDASLRRRPMERLRVLEAMGARFDGTRPLVAPFEVQGTASPRAAEVRLPVASAQVKSAILLAGTFASGCTRVFEPGLSRDHTERGLMALGVPMKTAPEGDGRWVELTGLDGPWSGADLEVPPDFSSAAFLLGAAVVTGATDLVVHAGANPTRIGFVEVLKAMGVEVQVDPLETHVADPEPRGRFRVASSAGLRGSRIEGAVALQALDELPLALGLAAFADGETELRDARELRVKESDRLEAMGRVLEAFGVRCELRPDGAVVRGGTPKAARVDAGGDHRIAMTAAVIGLGTPGTTVVDGAEVIDVSYPGFVETLRGLGADVEWAAPVPPPVGPAETQS